jgi:hypothetical protein
MVPTLGAGQISTVVVRIPVSPHPPTKKSPLFEGLSYPKTAKSTIRIERTTCCLRGGFWDDFDVRNLMI